MCACCVIMLLYMWVARVFLLAMCEYAALRVGFDRLSVDYAAIHVGWKGFSVGNVLILY